MELGSDVHHLYMLHLFFAFAATIKMSGLESKRPTLHHSCFHRIHPAQLTLTGKTESPQLDQEMRVSHRYFLAFTS